MKITIEKTDLNVTGIDFYRMVLESFNLTLLAASNAIKKLDDPIEALTQCMGFLTWRDYTPASKMFAAKVMVGAPFLPRVIAVPLMFQSKMTLLKFEY
ncbi:hypothetical protein [Enterovibrio norvegicus]|uniref:hypothetical protein n=1 Tax=Enterovibrio norvegicus TaxID=188144 RepID=UPI003D12AEC0